MGDVIEIPGGSRDCNRSGKLTVKKSLKSKLSLSSLNISSSSRRYHQTVSLSSKDSPEDGDQVDQSSINKTSDNSSVSSGSTVKDSLKDGSFSRTKAPGNQYVSWRTLRSGIGKYLPSPSSSARSCPPPPRPPPPVPATEIGVNRNYASAKTNEFVYSDGTSAVNEPARSPAIVDEGPRERRLLASVIVDEVVLNDEDRMSTECAATLPVGVCDAVSQSGYRVAGWRAGDINGWLNGGSIPDNQRCSLSPKADLIDAFGGDYGHYDKPSLLVHGSSLQSPPSSSAPDSNSPMSPGDLWLQAVASSLSREASHTAWNAPDSLHHSATRPGFYRGTSLPETSNYCNASSSASDDAWEYPSLTGNSVTEVCSRMNPSSTSGTEFPSRRHQYAPCSTESRQSDPFHSYSTAEYAPSGYQHVSDFRFRFDVDQRGRLFRQIPFHRELTRPPSKPVKPPILQLFWVND